jgi:predicted transcriptional regulator
MKRINFWIGDTAYCRLVELAAERDRKYSELLREAVDQYLRRESAPQRSKRPARVQRTRERA